MGVPVFTTGNSQDWGLKEKEEEMVAFLYSLQKKPAEQSY